METVTTNSTATVKNRKRLQILQNKGLRCALNVGSEMSMDELHVEANLLKLKHRRELPTLNVMYGEANNDVNLVRRVKGITVTRSQSKKCLAYLSGPKLPDGGNGHE